MKNQKGYTLLEVILAMAIGFMLMAVIWSILGLGVRSQSFTANEYEEQANIRYAIETINNRMRFFTVGFAVTEGDFKPSYNNDSGELEGVVAPWSYIGLSPDKTHLVHYEYKEEGYVTTDLTLPVEGLNLDLRFIKESNPQDDNLLTLFLKGYENERQTFDIKTTIDAINALHLIDWGDGTHNGAAVALAYRTEETPEIDKRPVAAMSMVLDTSGSMNDDVLGNQNNNMKGPPRIDILKDSLKIMFEDLSIGENTYVHLVPFHSNANIPNSNINDEEIDFKHNEQFRLISQENLGDEETGWKGLINKISANGGTNTGDGMRRGYYQLIDFNDNIESYGLDLNQKVENYIVIMVDGVTTMASAENVYRKPNNSWYNEYFYEPFILDRENVNADTIIDNSGIFKHINNWNGYGYLSYVNPTHKKRRPFGEGNALSDAGEAYVKMIGEDFIQANKYGGIDLQLDDNVFVIGFSGVKEELKSVKNIAKSVGISVDADDTDVEDNFVDNDRVFIAENAEDLEGIFKDISGYISENLWQVSGPRLEP